MDGSEEPQDVGEIDTDSVVNVSRPRLAILEKLADRPMTVSELSRSLRLSKGAVHRHVRILVDKGHVERRESERPWVYYALSERGRRVRKMVGLRFLFASTAAAVLSAVGLSALLAPRSPPTGGDSFQQGIGEVLKDATPSLTLMLAVVFLVSLYVVLRGVALRRFLAADGSVREPAMRE